MEQLPCGHISHSQDEEQRWASPEFEAETQRRKGLLQTLVTELKKKGRLDPGPYPPYPDTYETRRIYEVKQHFAYLKKRLPRPKYLKQIAIYQRSFRDFLAQPPCRRDQGVPLLPSKIPGLLQPSEIPTPRTGGLRPSQAIRQRNARITELVREGNSNQAICATLDREKCSVSSNWRKQSIQTWRQAYRHKRDSVHSLISKIATKT